MPKRKRLPAARLVPDYTGTGRSDKDPQNWLVEKANPLQALSETTMTLPEFKILDVYLSRIDSRNDKKRMVRFEKGELEKLLGVTRINTDDLKKRLRNMFQVVELRDPDKPKGYKLIQLFEEADAFQDEDGLWQVDLTCTPSSYEYIFNIENRGYLRYRLKNVINLTSRYSYILFLYLDKNRYRKSWDIKLSELKQLLNCTAETYSEFKRFNDLILKKCHSELTEKTELKYTYEPIRTGRKVTKICFTIETLNDIEEQDTEQLTLFPQNIPDENTDPLQERLEFFSEACDNRFSIEDMQVIFDLLVQIIPEADSDLKRYDYLAHKYHMLTAEEARKKTKGEKPILHPNKYLITLIERDLQ